MKKKLSWWGTLKLFLLLITFALFIYVVSNVPASLVLFNKLLLMMGMNIMAAVLELLKVVKDEPQAVLSLMWLPFLCRKRIREVVVWNEYPATAPPRTGHYMTFDGGVYDGAWWSASAQQFLWHSDEGLIPMDGQERITHWAEQVKGPKLT